MTRPRPVVVVPEERKHRLVVRWRNNLRQLGYNPWALPGHQWRTGLATELRDAGLPTLPELAREFGMSYATAWKVTARGTVVQEGEV